ncbi:unnamed protein product, partial [Arabidopsis halleri]
LSCLWKGHLELVSAQHLTTQKERADRNKRRALDLKICFVQKTESMWIGFT